MGNGWANQYLDYALGYNLTNRMPLWVAPPSKISLDQVFQFMRNHYEGTALDMTGLEFSDVGASFGNNAQRSHPLTWAISSTEDPNVSGDYFHERPIGTPQTGWNFVGQSRKWMPKELSGLLWFGVDDASTTAHFPIYGSALRVPDAYAGQGAQDGVTPPLMTFNIHSAFTAFNLVANWAYSRWALIYPDVYAQIIDVESHFIQEMKTLDRTASMKYETEGIQQAVEFVTEKCVQMGNDLVERWVQFFGEIFMKYRDGYILTPSDAKSCGCATVGADYSQTWLTRIVTDTGDHYKVPSEGKDQNSIRRDPAKLRLLTRR
jgi:dipeptidase